MIKAYFCLLSHIFDVNIVQTCKFLSSIFLGANTPSNSRLYLMNTDERPKRPRDRRCLSLKKGGGMTSTNDQTLGLHLLNCHKKKHKQPLERFGSIKKFDCRITSFSHPLFPYKSHICFCQSSWTYQCSYLFEVLDPTPFTFL